MPIREDRMEPGPRAVRRPAVAGMFYPGERDRLVRDVDALLGEFEATHLSGRVLALVEPHAGYPYSGAVAAAGYRELDAGSIDLVFLVGPSHRAAFAGVALWDGDAAVGSPGDGTLWSDPNNWTVDTVNDVLPHLGPPGDDITFQTAPTVDTIDLETDRTETTDLAEEHPDRIRRLQAMYNSWANECGVLPWPPQRAAAKEASR